MAKILSTVLTITIAIICVGTVLVPTLSDATKTEETFTNEGVFNYGVFTSEDTYKLEWDSSTAKLEVNDTEVTIPGVAPPTVSTRYSIIASENMLVRFGSTAGGYAVQVVGKDSTDASLSPAVETMSLTIDGGVLSVDFATTVGGAVTTKTFNFTEMYAIVPTADEAVLKASSSAVYIKGDSELYATGMTTVTNWSNVFHFEGTYDDGITITSPNVANATFDNIEWNIEPVSGYDDLYKLTSVEFDITSGETTVHATYSYFAVPAEVTAELSQHLSSAEITIIAVIPVLMICAILIIAVGMIRGRND